jgi:hypothetical protein
MPDNLDSGAALRRDLNAHAGASARVKREVRVDTLRKRIIGVCRKAGIVLSLENGTEWIATIFIRILVGIHVILSCGRNKCEFLVGED